MLSHTRWTCDRCHDQVELAHRQQPDGWIGLEVYTPPLAAEPAQGMRFHLCGSCQRDVAKLFKREVS